jgi:hypothetical protein
VIYGVPYNQTPEALVSPGISKSDIISFHDSFLYDLYITPQDAVPSILLGFVYLLLAFISPTVMSFFKNRKNTKGYSFVPFFKK